MCDCGTLSAPPATVAIVSFHPGDRVFVDESKSRAYILAATATQPRNSTQSEKQLRALLLPGQSRFHFKKERDSRRRALLSQFARLELRVVVYVARDVHAKVGRDRCIDSVIDDMIAATAERIYFEQDVSLVTVDRRRIRERIALHGAAGTISYDHVAPHQYPLLWVSDAVAWCYQAGGDWVRRVSPLVSAVKQV